MKRITAAVLLMAAMLSPVPALAQHQAICREHLAEAHNGGQPAVDRSINQEVTAFRTPGRAGTGLAGRDHQGRKRGPH